MKVAFVAAFAGLNLLTVEAEAARAIAFAPAIDGADAAIVAIADEKDLSAIEPMIGVENAAALQAGFAKAVYKAKEGATESFVSGGAGLGEIHVVGVKKDGMRRRDWADFGARAAALALKSEASRIAIVAPGAQPTEIAESALGAVLGQHRFLKYKSDPKEKTGELLFVADDADAAKAAWTSRGAPLSEAVLWARDMQAEPANALYPEEFVARARRAFEGVDNVSFEILDHGAIRKLGMGALSGVGQGSVRPPRLFIVRYRGGAADAAPVAFVGKGITFDSGGVSLKPTENMWKMKADMTGAAVAVAAVLALAKSNAPVNVVGVAALAENMPDGGAIRPGDVLKAMSGKTIEIMSTDAEGRLVLADAVWYAQQKDNPALLVDVATLTGSVGRALGDEYAGLFARDDGVADRLLRAGEAAGEDLWRLPLHHNHFEQIKSDIADIKNGATGDPGASTAAAFIASFIKRDTPWAHLDIAGVDWRANSTAPTMPKGASAFGIRLLYELAMEGETEIDAQKSQP